MHMYLHACVLTTSVQVSAEVCSCPLELELQVALHCLVLEGHCASLTTKLSLQPCVNTSFYFDH